MSADFFNTGLFSHDLVFTVAQKGHTCKLKMFLQTKNLTCKLKMLVQIKNSTCKLKIVHDYYCPRMDFVLFGKVFKFYYTLIFF